MKHEKILKELKKRHDSLNYAITVDQQQIEIYEREVIRHKKELAEVLDAIACLEDDNENK